MKIIITGGASLINNLGDQAMILTLIEFCQNNNKDAEIVLMDETAFLNKNIYGNLNFKVLPDMPMIHKIKLINRGLSFIYRNLVSGTRFFREIEKQIINEYETCDIIIQLAGFGVSSQMAYKNALSRIWDIGVARELGKKIILMPQSVGPLDFKGLKRIIFNHYLKKYINYPEYVMCRESMGKTLLEKAGCKKAEIHYDIVLSRPGKIDIGKLSKIQLGQIPNIGIDGEKDIVIVPNSRFLNYISLDDICDIYEGIIKGCIEITGGKVIVFNHASPDDDKITLGIYSRFTDNPDVILINGGLSCMDAEEFFSKFAIGIPARWHSNVHMIRAGLPHVVFGWAEKYRETALLFDNMENLFDIRNVPAQNNIISAVERVYNNRKMISGEIVRIENEIKKTFCLDLIIKDITEESC